MSKKSNKRTTKSTEDREAVWRMRMIRIVVILFSIILILSMLLSLVSQ